MAVLRGTYPSKRELQWEWWMRRIRQARAYYRPWFEGAKPLIKLYNMDAADQREKTAELLGPMAAPRIKANIVFGWVDQHIANLAAHNPTFRVSPTNQQGLGSERAVARINNYYYNELSQLRQDKRVLLDAMLAPWGVKKLGFEADIDLRIDEQLSSGEHVFTDPEQEALFLSSRMETFVDPESDHQLFIEHHVQFLQRPDAPTDPEAIRLLQANIQKRQGYLDRGSTPGRHADVRRESVWAKRWRPDQFLVDTVTDDGIYDASWVGFGWERQWDDVISDGSLENLADLQPSGDRLEGALDHSEKFEVDDFSLVRGYEIWARNFPVKPGVRRDLYIQLAEGNEGKFLRYEQEWPYQRIEDYPCEMLHFNSAFDTWFNKPPLQLAGFDSVQRLTNELLDAVLYEVRKSKPIIIYDPGVIDEPTLSEILMAPGMTLHPIPGLKDMGGNAVQVVEFKGDPSDKTSLANLIMSLGDRAAGMPQPVALPKTDTATEANIQDRRNTAREDERGFLFSQYQVRSQRKWWQLLTEFKPDRMFLVDPHNADETLRFASISEEMAAGEFDFDMDVTSANVNLALERKNWGDLFNQLSGAAAIFQELYGQPPRLDLLAEKIMVMGFGIQNPEHYMPWLESLGSDEVGQLVNTAIGESTPLREAIGRVEEGGPLIREAVRAQASGNGQAAGSAVRPDRDRGGI